MTTYKHLTQTQVKALATRYGLNPSERLVIELAKQADEYHGMKANKPNWGTDNLGVYQAYNLLDGYLCEESRVMQCDAKAHAEFCRNAY